MKGNPPESFDAYIGDFPLPVQKILKSIRQTIKKVAPAAQESISYGMPAYKHNGKPMIYFAGYENHIGLYATPSGHATFKKELSNYKQGKGSVQLPLAQPVPLDLIRDIAKFRYEQLGGDKTDFTKGLSAPAKRALESAGIKNVRQLSKFSKENILELHGIGKTAIPILEAALKENGLAFKKIIPVNSSWILITHSP